MKQPIKLQEQRNPRETSKISRSVTKLKVRMSQSPSIRARNEKLLSANYAADKISQIIIALFALSNNYNRTAVSRLHSPWRGKFQSFSFDEREFLSMDNRLVIPQAMRAMSMCSLQYGHLRCDAMLGIVAEIR